MAETVVMLSTIAAASAAGGSSYTAAGFFRSPDTPSRPIMVLVNCFTVRSEHRTADVAVAGLEETQRNVATGLVESVELPAGPAVVAESRKPVRVPLGEGTIDLDEHSITAWIPSPGVVTAVAITSNNTEDWEHVKDLARGIFETLDWNEPASSSGT